MQEPTFKTSTIKKGSSRSAEGIAMVRLGELARPDKKMYFHGKNEGRQVSSLLAFAYGVVE